MTDVSVSGGGFLTLGPVSGQNVTFDDNEIMARNNGAFSPLFLNADGGNVIVGSRLGIGTTTPSATLDIYGNNNVGLNVSSSGTYSAPQLQITQRAAGDYARIRMGDGASATWDITAGIGSDTAMHFYAQGDNRMSIGTDGTVTVGVLTITGGSDVAEPFQMSAKDIPAGTVLVIDENNPGKLAPSSGAYDSHVAGIVSGANGIKPGLSLHQDGALEGGQNVALSGRVYALADASNGPIRPGDLLTTSDTPGHCMKVTDHLRAQGAIIGKAMNSLESGKGMVLVLVSLQ